MSLMLIEKLRQQLNAALPQRFQEDWTSIDNMRVIYWNCQQGVKGKDAWNMTNMPGFRLSYHKDGNKCIFDCFGQLSCIDGEYDVVC